MEEPSQELLGGQATLLFTPYCTKEPLELERSLAYGICSAQVGNSKNGTWSTPTQKHTQQVTGQLELFMQERSDRLQLLVGPVAILPAVACNLLTCFHSRVNMTCYDLEAHGKGLTPADLKAS